MLTSERTIVIDEVVRIVGREGLFTLLDITSYIKTQYKFNARQSKLPDLQKMNEFIKSTKVMVENCWNYEQSY